MAQAYWELIRSSLLAEKMGAWHTPFGVRLLGRWPAELVVPFATAVLVYAVRALALHWILRVRNNSENSLFTFFAFFLLFSARSRACCLFVGAGGRFARGAVRAPARRSKRRGDFESARCSIALALPPRACAATVY
jgi:hypothetical protein